MMTTAYRDPLERARETLAELTESLDRTLPAAEARERIVLRRAARVVFGGVGIGGAALWVAATIANGASSSPRRFVLSDILIEIWLAAAAAYVLTRIVGVLARRPRNPPPTGAILDDIRRFTAVVTERREGRFLGALSLILPAIAISLLMPLTLHLGFWRLFNLRDSYGEANRGFDEWIAISMLIVGHAHLALAAMAAKHASHVARVPRAVLAEDGNRGFKALFWTIVVSAVPGIVLFAVPPLLVAVTGVAFVPFLWIATRRIALAERTALEVAGVERV